MGDTPIETVGPFPWMREEGVIRLMAAIAPARFVGGAVRDALLQRAVTDIDVATPLHPDDVMRRLVAIGVTTMPTGLAHGTVTAVLTGAPTRHIEITTLRRDVETFGRQARVAPTEDWREDALRRDFTMNALYLDPDGLLYDPIGGLPDLRAGRIRFVGDPETRIREDVLRVLRFYRFFAHYGRGDADPDARAACHALAPLVPRLSGERVAAELLKLLAAPDPVPTLTMMASDGVLAFVVPDAASFERLSALIVIEARPDPLRRLAALVRLDRSAATTLAERLRLGNAARARLEYLVVPPWPFDPTADERTRRRALYHLGRDLYRDLVFLAGDASRAATLLAEVDAWREPSFPVRGADVAALGIESGPRIGKLLADLERWWEEGDFCADRRACLAELARRVAMNEIR
jgi:poly(A) polymerase